MCIHTHTHTHVVKGENINNYAKGYDSPYGYINRNGLFDLILNFLGDKKSKKVSAAITAKELNKKQR